MAEKKIIAVLGATGAQGGGLVRAILADKTLVTVLAGYLISLTVKEEIDATAN